MRLEQNMMQGTEAKPPRPRIVVVGAGFGGLAATQELAAHDFDITLIDRQNHHLFQPLLYQVATAGLSPADIATPIRSIVKRHPRTRVLLGNVVAIDKDARQVRLRNGATMIYDALILATGASHSYFGHDDWAQHAPGIKTIDDAITVRRRILLAMERAETHRQENIAERDELLTFLVIGGGPTGVEMAGAIAELTRHAAGMDFRFIGKSQVRILLVEAGPRLLPSFPEALSENARRSLEHLGVEVRLNSPVTAIEQNGVIVNDSWIKTAATIWAAGVQASPAARWIGAESDRAGRAIVTEDLSVPGYPEIFVIGDTASVTNADGTPVPGVAPAAKQQGHHVAQVIKARFGIRKPPARFRYHSSGNLATIGRKRAVVDFGWARFTGFFAWLLWTTAHIYFLVGFRNRLIVSANWLWNYVTFDRGARLITGNPPPDDVL